MFERFNREDERLEERIREKMNKIENLMKESDFENTLASSLLMAKYYMKDLEIQDLCNDFLDPTKLLLKSEKFQKINNLDHICMNIYTSFDIFTKALTFKFKSKEDLIGFLEAIKENADLYIEYLKNKEDIKITKIKLNHTNKSKRKRGKKND